MVIAVAKRARELREGASPLVECDSRNPIVIAMEEIAAGKVTLRYPTAEELEAAVRERAGEPPVAKPQAPSVSDLLKIEPEDEEESVEGLLIEELEEEDEEETEASDESEDAPEKE